MYITIAVVTILGLYKAWAVGANDFANSMSSAVGSKAITLRRAIILGACCEFVGAVLVGSDVSDTIRKRIVDPESFRGFPETLAVGMGCVLLSSAVWLHVATWLGMPVSATHAVVGSLAGFGVVAAGWSAVCWSEIGHIAVTWVVSPIASLAMAFLTFKLISRHVLGRASPVSAAVRGTPVVAFAVVVVVVLATIYDGLKHLTRSQAALCTGCNAVIIAVGAGLAAAVAARAFATRYLRGSEGLALSEQLHRVEAIFAPLVVLSACSVAFAHGANDVAGAIGPLAAVVDILETGSVKMRAFVPPWALALGGVGIVLGLSTYGYRVVHTVGTKLTQLTPSRGVAANLATATTVLVFARMGLPTSTSHTVVGAVLGVGFARGLSAINERVTRDIICSWLVTVPASALLAALLFFVCRSAHVDLLLRGAMQATAAGS